MQSLIKRIQNKFLHGKKCAASKQQKKNLF